MFSLQRSHQRCPRYSFLFQLRFIRKEVSHLGSLFGERRSISSDDLDVDSMGKSLKAENLQYVSDKPRRFPHAVSPHWTPIRNPDIHFTHNVFNIRCIPHTRNLFPKMHFFRHFTHLIQVCPKSTSSVLHWQRVRALCMSDENDECRCSSLTAEDCSRICWSRSLLEISYIPSGEYITRFPLQNHQRCTKYFSFSKSIRHSGRCLLCSLTPAPHPIPENSSAISWFWRNSACLSNIYSGSYVRDVLMIRVYARAHYLWI